ncbi:MAG TPA: hypothetical protein ENJ43_01310, partial [Gammaproteobacteria bacterium]|nr:hypothetical protein [Gammaproteobacteria bacterium]
MREPAFHLSGCRSLRIDTEEWGDRATGYLARSVARTPTNLIAQVQRINSCLAQRDSEGAYGALLDLFIALGEKGLLLRRRMLVQARPLLGEERSRALAQHLEKGLLATDPMPPSSHSMLSKGLTGTRQLVMRVDNDNDVRERDPLDDAIGYLEYSQIDKAQAILERALLEDPSRTDLHSNLLAIYRASGDSASFARMRSKL